jgi:hypothetical protein
MYIYMYIIYMILHYFNIYTTHIFTIYIYTSMYTYVQHFVELSWIGYDWFEENIGQSHIRWVENRRFPIDFHHHVHHQNVTTFGYISSPLLRQYHVIWLVVYLIFNLVFRSYYFCEKWLVWCRALLIKSSLFYPCRR